MVMCQKEKPYLRHVAAIFDASVHFERRVSKHCLVEMGSSYYGVPCAFAGRVVSVKKYVEILAIFDRGQQIARHTRSFVKKQYIIELQHYLPILERKPGAVRNRSPIQTLPVALDRVREDLRRFIDCDNQFTDILTTIPQCGFEVVCTTCDIALEDKAVNSAIILNYISMLTESVQPVSIAAPPKLTLQHPPLADCARYNRLRAVTHA